MKQQNNKDISILLYALLLFSFGIGWVYSRTTKETQENKLKNTQLAEQAITQENMQEIAQEKNCDNQIETLVNTPETPAYVKTSASMPDAPMTSKTPAHVKTASVPETPKSTIEIPKIPEPPTEVLYDAKKVQDEEITVGRMLAYAKSLIRSKGINTLVKLLKYKCPKKTIVETISKIVEQNKGDLSRYEQLKIILALAKHYEKDKDLQGQIFGIISSEVNKKDLEVGKTPLLFAAVRINESAVTPTLAEWHKKNAQNKPEAKDSNKFETKDLVKETLDYAAKNDHWDVIKKLNETGIKITPKMATELLWVNLKANKTGAASKTIETLKNLGANLNSQEPGNLTDPNFTKPDTPKNSQKPGSPADSHTAKPDTPKSKLTPLIQAIKNENTQAVKQLLQAGADPKLRSEDKAIGFPLQVARELKQIEIENLLRAHGARD